MRKDSLMKVLALGCMLHTVFFASMFEVVTSISTSPRTKEAYVTLLYGDEFLLGVRVLGRSIKESNSTKDMVVLIPENVVSDSGKRLLEADGWLVKTITLLDNPNPTHPARFWGVYSKLSIFNLTDYDKVLYLDADTIVMRNADDMFKCRGFCANVKHSERLNSGVMVLEPSQHLFQDMLAKLALPSYTGGDQGFLNSYYPEFANAILFDPASPPHEERNQERLAAIYNADVGLYLIGGSKWMIDESEIRVLHFTLGPLKPWDWWCEWLLPPVTRWQEFRMRLPESLPGTGGGQTKQLALMTWLLACIPLLVLGVFSRRLIAAIVLDMADLLLLRSGLLAFVRAQLGLYKYRPPSFFTTTTMYPAYATSIIKAVTGSDHHHHHHHHHYLHHQQMMSMPLRVPSYIGIMSILVSFIVGLLSLVTALFMVPRQVLPWTGLVLVYEWTMFLFVVVFGKYLSALHAWGRASSAPPPPLLSASSSASSPPPPAAASSSSSSSAVGMMMMMHGSINTGTGTGTGGGGGGGGGGDSSGSKYASTKGHSKMPSAWDMETAMHALSIMAAAVFAPSLPFLLGVHVLLPRIGLFLVGLLVLVGFMTHVAERLGVRWFLLGRDEWSQSHCFECCEM